MTKLLITVRASSVFDEIEDLTMQTTLQDVKQRIAVEYDKPIEVKVKTQVQLPTALKISFSEGSKEMVSKEVVLDKVGVQEVAVKELQGHLLIIQVD